MLFQANMSGKESIHNMLKFRKAALAVCTAAALVMGAQTVLASDQVPYVALGADLSTEQRIAVLDLLGLTEEDLTHDTVVTVTNAEEHEYLDAYVSPSVIGSRALSSCKVMEEAKEHGITVEVHNITYVTPAMYENALATAGMKNASVVVAGPSPISGTAALVGAMKAYSQMHGTPISPELIDSATDELVKTGELAESLGDSEEAAEIIAALKQVVAENDLKTDEDINNAIDEVAGKLEISLSEEDRQLILDLMEKLSTLDLDADNLAEQARGIYSELQQRGFSLSDYGITKEEAQGLLARLIQFIKELLSSLGNK